MLTRTWRAMLLNFYMEMSGILFGLAVATEHIHNLVLVKFLHFVAGRAEIFAWVELTWLGGEHFAYSGSHGQTAV